MWEDTVHVQSVQTTCETSISLQINIISTNYVLTFREFAMELVHADRICIEVLVYVQYEVKCPLDSTKWIIQESRPQFENRNASGVCKEHYA